MAELNQVIVVEGDQGFAADLERVFSANGARVIVCDNTETMVESVAETLPDLIMLSVELPQGKGAGYLACNKLKKNDDTREVPVVLMSAQATEEDFAKHRKLKTHADDYLRKPFSDDDLLKKLENLLGFEIGGGEFEKLQQQVHDFLEEKAHLEAEIREKGTRITELEAALEGAEAQAQKAADTAATELKGDVKKLKAAYDKLQEENARLSEEASQAEERRDAALKEAENADESLAALQSDLEEATNQLFAEQERLAATQEELDQADTALEERRTEQAELEGRLEEMRGELDGLEQQLQPLQSSMEELKMREAELRGERDSHEERLATLRTEIEAVETESSTLEAQLAERQQEQVELDGNLKTGREELAALEQDVASLVAEKDSLAQVEAELKEAATKRKAVKAQIEKLVKIHSRLQDELASMQQIVDDDGTD